MCFERLLVVLQPTRWFKTLVSKRPGYGHYMTISRGFGVVSINETKTVAGQLTFSIENIAGEKADLCRLLSSRAGFISLKTVVSGLFDAIIGVIWNTFTSMGLWLIQTSISLLQIRFLRTSKYTFHKYTHSLVEKWQI